MKIYGKQVLIGSKKLCIEYTSKIFGGFSDSYLNSIEFKGSTLEDNIIFIQDKHGYLIDIRDITGNGFLALNLYGGAVRYRTKPYEAGDHYVADLRPYMSDLDQETLFDLKTLIQELKDENSISTKL